MDSSLSFNAENAATLGLPIYSGDERKGRSLS
jgi:hypothetical protein